MPGILLESAALQFLQFSWLLGLRNETTFPFDTGLASHLAFYTKDLIF